MPSFADQYAHAKRMQADLFAQEIIDICDDDSQDTIIDPESGKERCNNEWVQRSRLKIDTRKWIASKLLPKVYGERQQVDSNVTLLHESGIKDLA